MSLLESVRVSGVEPLQTDRVKNTVLDGVDEANRFLDLRRDVEQRVQRPKCLEDVRVVEAVDILEDHNIAL